MNKPQLRETLVKAENLTIKKAEVVVKKYGMVIINHKQKWLMR